MADWNRAAAQLEKLAELQTRDYQKVMKPEDITWIKHHLALATMNPTTDIVEFSKQFLELEPPRRVAKFVKKSAPTYAELQDRFPRRRRRIPRCSCAIQDYCDVCQED